MCGSQLLVKCYLAKEIYVGNSNDTLAVAVKNSSEVFDHIPRLLSLIYSVFIQSGEIVCRITGTGCDSADLPQGEMEIPCILISNLKVSKNAAKLNI